MVSARLGAVFAAAWLLGAALDARAAGTPAGTNIQNTAQITYQIGGASVSTSSNTTSVTVAEILDAIVTIANPTVSAPAGATQQELVFTVTNRGNGTEQFELVGLSAGVTGDDFDPVLSSPAIYFDSDDSGDLSASDVAYVAGTNDPNLAPDQSVRVLLVNSIPAGAADGTRGRSQLTARTRTGSGDPGRLFEDDGDGGVDAIVGTTGGQAISFGEYLVQAFQLSALKTQGFQDPFGGEKPIPGARINYQIVITPSGSGTAIGVVFTDAIPANTTYVAGSLELNGAALSDSGGNDAGEYTATPAPLVRVNLGDLTAASGPQTIEFAVTID